MKLTAAAARGKICPLSLSTGGEGRVCHGNSCMAWRATTPPRGFIRAPGDFIREPPRPDHVTGSWLWQQAVPGLPDAKHSSGWIEPIAELEARTEGYCGMAGAP